jgi:hypothetical protein
VHWRRHRERHWRTAAVTNAVGAVLSAVVLAVTAITKFAHGAWLVVLLIPVIVWACRKIHVHYQQTHQALIPSAGDPDAASATVQPSPDPQPAPEGPGPERACNPGEVSNLILVPLAAIDASGLHALAYAASLAQPVLAVHISADEREAARFHAYWRAWGEHLPLEVIVSPYRSTVAPLANYIEALHYQQPDLHADRSRTRTRLQKTLATCPARPHRPTPKTYPAPAPRNRDHQHPIPPRVRAALRSDAQPGAGQLRNDAARAEPTARICRAWPGEPKRGASESRPCENDVRTTHRLTHDRSQVARTMPLKLPIRHRAAALPHPRRE